MMRRLMVLLLCLGVAILFTTLSFSQDEPAKADDKKAEDKADKGLKEAEKEGEAEKIKVGPEAKVYSDGTSTFVNSQVQFKLTSKDNLFTDKIEYKINGGEVKAYESPFSIPDEGIHVITYYSIDKIGNKEDEKTYKVIVDNTPPVIMVTSNKPVQKINEKIYISKDFRLAITAKDEVSGLNKIEYSLNGKDYSEYVVPFDIPEGGEIELKVKAIDNVNNLIEKFVFKIFDETGKPVELSEESVKMLADNVSPTVEIKADKEIKQIENKNYVLSDIKYTVNATDNESGIAAILYRLDGKGDFIPYSREIIFTTNGQHKIEAKAVDKVGNASNIATLSLFVDIIPPETMIETISK
jgi:hypothetical protein